MAACGLIPFASTYAVFASLRALDMVCNSIHYPRLNVKIAASHSSSSRITPSRSARPLSFARGRMRRLRQSRAGGAGARGCGETGRHGIQVRVLDRHTLKPLDVPAVLQAANDTGAIVTTENTIWFGGPSALADVFEKLRSTRPAPLSR